MPVRMEIPQVWTSKYLKALNDEANLHKDARLQLTLQSLTMLAAAVSGYAALMASAQIAVYPIDLSGVSSGGAGVVDISTPAGVVTVQTGSANAELRRATQRWDTHEAMTDIASDTGSEALYGSNDLKNLMAHSIERGDSYYTLAYVPENRDGNGKYRKIEVKLSQPAKLYFRRGYYALPGFEIEGVSADQLLAGRGAPQLAEVDHAAA
jgi:VWFA-related protein